jgi:4-amino-4-deoxy-L-arabinose transferase-like glycosyltransferase
VTIVLACVLLAREPAWLPWLRAVIAVAGVGAAALLLVASRLPRATARAVAGIALAVCLAAPAAYSVATAATPHHGAIPGVGASGGTGFGGLLDAPDVSAPLVTALRTDANRYTWTAAAVGSTTAAGYQLATGTPVMAVGGFNGTDPAPTLDQFRQSVKDNKIHYFIGGKLRGPMRGASTGSKEPSDIAAWVAANFPARTIDGVTLYDLTSPLSFGPPRSN